MNDAGLFVLGFTIGIPFGAAIAFLLSPLDEWLDVHWRR